MKQGECLLLCCFSLTWGAMQGEGCELHVDAAREQEWLQDRAGLRSVVPLENSSICWSSHSAIFQLKLASCG